MRKRALLIAVAALVLSAAGAFAEPPTSDTPGDTSSVDYYRFQQLPDAHMAAVMGEGWLSGSCTLAVRTAAYVLFADATRAGDLNGRAIGLSIAGAAAAICA